VARSKLPIATGIGGVGAGYLLGKLSSHNLEQIIVGVFQLADKHGPFALFALLLVGITVGMAVWLIRLTILAFPFYKIGLYSCGFLVHPL
jgi:ABC-type proline/glycine betaine transport system permease subunit